MIVRRWIEPGPELDALVIKVLVEKCGWKLNGFYLYKPNGDCPNANSQWSPSVQIGDAFDLVDYVRDPFEFKSLLLRRDVRSPYTAAFDGKWASGRTVPEAISLAFLLYYGEKTYVEEENVEADQEAI